MVFCVLAQASQSSVNDAYRRLSRLYHPDKHTEPERKQQAEAMFNKIKSAYEGETNIGMGHGYEGKHMITHFSLREKG